MNKVDATWYKIKFIRRKGKIRKIITYTDQSVIEKHTRIKEFLEERLIFSKFTKAYVKNSSIFNNAKAHMYNDIFIKLDIKDFFISINHKILLDLLFSQLNVNPDQTKVSKMEISRLISICSIEKKGLPLGLITSPILSNIYLKEFDNILYGKLKKMNFKNIIYTRYADDITISFKSEDTNEFIQGLKVEILNLVEVLLKRYKLKLNRDKISLINLNISNHVRITGVSVTKDSNNYRRISIGRKRINKLYHDALNLFIKIKVRNMSLDNHDFLKIRQIKGMESFIFSIEKNGYDTIYSEKMKLRINELGFESLSQLIKNLPEKNF
ncbi:MULTISPECIES: reverse transcriptase domain-containing protein [Fictibacillus]|uniref:RNA-directed DNA polymerase n=1 Tax=Fictibacillus nanhaiensis TaxID=742169 RepID=A0ABS2ZLY4_9BACL|nr:hypothetical protein [Fictibacillus nanhaiensis]